MSKYRSIGKVAVRFSLFIFGGFILLALVISIGALIAPRLLDSIKTPHVKAEVSKLRANAEQLLDQKISDQIQLWKQNGSRIDENIASSKIDVCYLTHTDSGWMINHWYQNCYLRYVEGFTVSKVQSTQRTQPLTQNCGLNQQGSVEESYSFLFRPAGAQSQAYHCKIPNPLQGTWSVRGPVRLDNELVTKVYRSFDPRKITNEKDQQWIILEKHYYKESLGCAGILFCDSPRAKAIIGP